MYYLITTTKDFSKQSLYCICFSMKSFNPNSFLSESLTHARKMEVGIYEERGLDGGDDEESKVKEGRKRKGRSVEKIIESCFVFVWVVLTASYAITIHSTGRLLLSYSRYCVESAYWGDCGGSPQRGLLPPLWRDRRSARGSSRALSFSLPPHSLIHSLAEIFQKSKTCDKSGRERHTPFIQTLLVRHTMSLSIQNRAFVLRSSTKSARFCQLLWLLNCESKKNKSL